ncbi:hypothetical protein LXL04_016311 [Taraxacum kok-saghyz]
MKEFDYFPNACIAYRILLTIPVTVAFVERSFSKLNFLKSYLLSTMTQERLSGLAMISIENEILESKTTNITLYLKNEFSFSRLSSNLARRRTASSNSSPTRPLAPTRIIYRETPGTSSFSESDLDLPFWQQTWFIGLLLVMAISFFRLAVFLFLTLDSDYTSTPVYAATSEGVELTDFFGDSQVTSLNKNPSSTIKFSLEISMNYAIFQSKTDEDYRKTKMKVVVKTNGFQTIVGVVKCQY